MNEIANILYSIKSDIYSYEDLRDYIKYLLDTIKKTHDHITHRQLSSYFGFKSPNFLLLLAQKKRQLSAKTAGRIAKVLALNKTETEYFLLMAQLSLSTELTDKHVITKRMIQIKKNKNLQNIPASAYHLYENWYQVILRELLSSSQIKQTPEALAEYFIEPITPQQIKSSLKKLENLGLIERQNNTYQPKQKNIRTGDSFSNTYILLFHQKMLEFAKQSLTKFNGQQRYISSLSLPVNTEASVQIRQLTEEFKIKILNICEEVDTPDQIMQLNIQYFPITKVLHEKK